MQMCHNLLSKLQISHHEVHYNAITNIPVDPLGGPGRDLKLTYLLVYLRFAFLLHLRTISCKAAFLRADGPWPQDVRVRPEPPVVSTFA